MSAGKREAGAYTMPSFAMAGPGGQYAGVEYAPAPTYGTATYWQEDTLARGYNARFTHADATHTAPAGYSQLPPYLLPGEPWAPCRPGICMNSNC